MREFSRNYARILLIVVLGILCSGATIHIDAMYFMESNSEQINDVLLASGLFYKSHDPITILNDSDFQKLGFSGDGTDSYPYVIDFLSISSTIDAIHIENTRAHFIITDCIISSPSEGAGVGILIANVTNGEITQSEFQDRNIAISIHDSYGLLIEDIDISNCQIGLRVNRTAQTILNQSSISDVYIGVDIRQSTNISLIEVNAEKGTRGFFITNSNNTAIANSSSIGNSLDGVYVYQSEKINISNCDIYGNKGKGIVLNLCNDSIMLSNGMGWNGLNALDNGLRNIWNQSVQGNYWDDLGENDIYNIAGSAGSHDYHPTILMRGESQEFLNILESQISFSIDVQASGFHPSHYEVHVNGTLIIEEDWNGTNIEISQVISYVGSYNYTIYLYNTWNYNISVTMWVTISDITAPTINHPIDIMYMEGYGDVALTWTVFDRQPLYYEIYRNNLKIAQLQWDGEDIQVPIDGLSPGIYYYEIIVYDRGGNSASDTVRVTVLADPNLTTPVTNNTQTTTTGQEIGILGYVPLFASILFVIGSLFIVVAAMINKELIFSKRTSIDVTKDETH